MGIKGILPIPSIPISKGLTRFIPIDPHLGGGIRDSDLADVERMILDLKKKIEESKLKT
jgi:hypothetical protein